MRPWERKEKLKVFFLIFLLFLSFLTVTLGLSTTQAATVPIKPQQALEYKVVRQQLTQGGMLLGKVSPDVKVFLDQRQIEVTSRGFWLIAFGRDALLEHKIKLLSSKGEERVVFITLKPRRYDIQEVTGIDPSQVEPDEGLQKRIAEENKKVIEAREVFSKNNYFLESFSWPAKGPLSGFYGSQRVFNGIPKQPHYGLDIAAPKGALVKAPAGGKVTLVYRTMFLAGNLIILDHGMGLSSSFLHLDSISVKLGQTVKRGQMIGTVGQTGRATGPHLDWRINWFQERIDPLLWMKK